MRFSHRKQKPLLTLLFIVEFFVVSVLPASAGLFSTPSIPSASSIMSDMEKRYHLDTGAIQDQAETFNVGDNKKMTPQASISFSPSDPKEGEKLSAKAYPIYFSNDEKSLYYTWYLKHSGCNLTNSPSAATRTLCDRNGDSRITVEDWKVEAAKILAQNGYERPTSNVPPDADDDGYSAKMGGSNKANTPDYCYLGDPKSGTIYELADTIAVASNSCPAGTEPVCMVGELQVTTDPDGVISSTITPNPDPNLPSTSTTDPQFTFTDTNKCSVSGVPACSNTTPICNVGSARCVANPTTTTSCGSAMTSCFSAKANPSNRWCDHIFPNAPGQTSGDGSFGASEESFWGTDPSDPDTADTGNKDEANVIGLRASTFTWSYVAGDQIGVAVEGTSMISTKHDDSSAMIMWAFSKNDCEIPLNKIGSYTETIKGYAVTIPTLSFDINKCLENNLVDPTKGGQSTKLEVNVTASPDNLVNDPGSDKSGDTVVAQATVDNAAKDLANMSFDWKVKIGRSTSALTGNQGTDVTTAFRTLGLLGATKGNALDSLKMKLDIPQGDINTYLCPNVSSNLLPCTDTGFLKFEVTAKENFSSTGAVRTGKSDVIVKFISTKDIISAYRVVATVPSQTARTNGELTKINLSGTKICDAPASLDRSVCRVIKNEIIGLKLNSTGLSNFRWTINGTELRCTSRVSGTCNDIEQGDTNFFPVTGNPGDTYTVAVTANEVATGKVVNLTRAFSVVAPTVTIAAPSGNGARPKFLGQYKDLSGVATSCPNGLCDDFSESIFQANSGSQVNFDAVFIPDFLKSTATKEWSLDGQVIPEVPTIAGEISFYADKPAPEIYNINLVAQVAQDDSVRSALTDIWGITQFESPEINFSISAQLEVQDATLADGPLIGPRKYLAAIASYIPASLMFTFRIFLSAILTLFALNFLHALLEERRIRAFVENFSRKE